MAPGMLDSEAVAAGIMKAEGAILGLFQETGLQDPQGVVHSENQWRHHGYHAYPGVDAQAASAAAVRGGLLIALRADVFAAEEVRDIVYIVPGKAMALDVVTAGGTKAVLVGGDFNESQQKKMKNQEKDAQPEKNKARNRFFGPQKPPQKFCAAVWRGRKI